LSSGAPVAEVTLTFADGDSQTFILKAGADTAEGNYPGANAAHPQAKIGVAWPYEAGGVDYVTIFSLAEDTRCDAPPGKCLAPGVWGSRQITQISVTATLPIGQFILRGLSLIHQPTTTSRSILLTTEGNYRQAHSGDVKIYENRAVLPRAFIVHQAEVVGNDDAAIATLQDPEFDPTKMIVRFRQDPGEHTGLLVVGQPSPRDQAKIIAYEPERVEIAATLDTPGWLVLTDTYYPGWQATVDGDPVEILPVNIMFRAVELPAGEHTVVFEFKPRSLQLGMLVSGLALVVFLVGLVMAIKRGDEAMRRSQSEETAEGLNPTQIDLGG
jgi:hypothetical protein